MDFHQTLLKDYIIGARATFVLSFPLTSDVLTRRHAKCKVRATQTPVNMHYYGTDGKVNKISRGVAMFSFYIIQTNRCNKGFITF